MANKNALKEWAKQKVLYNKKYRAFFNDFCQRNYLALVAAVVEKTPVDFGPLREGWSQHSRLLMQPERVVFEIYNPADYAVHVEYGYKQKPGMILKMEKRMGRLRFVKFLGWSRRYGVGDPTGEAEPDKHGFYTIVTRKRVVPGQHMLARSVAEFKEALPKRYAAAFAAFNRRNG